jgi:prepilin-type N-terminal cleavage/methylation domain-containing protein
MQSGFRRSSRGFSLAEMLVVVAIIGMLSLISVPAFINFRASNTFRSALRVFIDDVRFARQYSITHSLDVRIDLDATGSTTTSKNYAFYSSPDNGTTWNVLTIPGANGNVKTLPQQVWIDSTTSLPVGGTKPQIVYHPNGSVTLTAGAATGQVVLASTWTRMAFDRYTIVLSPSGQLTSKGSHS